MVLVAAVNAISIAPGVGPLIRAPSVLCSPAVMNLCLLEQYQPVTRAGPIAARPLPPATHAAQPF